ncbi:hypothetical protein B0H16DRAFT_1740612 [Mycena metata]|uniref:Uncharacterized protein n=1 Tax=Mycena metata TaxID=1033252 RepID=A0AAD7MH92_9AGAR|nr:hypothetical protein B0H16DRAFT_1740612 [Mycena metata]
MPGAYSSWNSADVQYKKVSAATVKGYATGDWPNLEAAWHAALTASRSRDNHPPYATPRDRGFRINCPAYTTSGGFDRPRTGLPNSPSPPPPRYREPIIIESRSPSPSPVIESRSTSPSPPADAPVGLMAYAEAVSFIEAVSAERAERQHWIREELAAHAAMEQMALSERSTVSDVSSLSASEPIMDFP